MITYDRIIHGDAVEEMRKLPDGAFDVVITSPPYNLRESRGGWKKSHLWKSNKLKDGYDGHNDNLPWDKYVKWQRECLTEMLRLVPETGAVFYNHKEVIRKGILRLNNDILDGFPLRQKIIWARPGGINFNSNYYLPTYETIYLIAKPEFRLVGTEYREPDVWHITQDQYHRNPHPAPFPISLPNRIIRTTGAKTVLDPFVGSGSTALAAIQHNAKYVGIDQSEVYVRLAERRIAKEKEQARML